LFIIFFTYKQITMGIWRFPWAQGQIYVRICF